MWKDDSPLKAQGYYIDADKVRFVNGLPETIYGWERGPLQCRERKPFTDDARQLAYGLNQLSINNSTTTFTTSFETWR